MVSEDFKLYVADLRTKIDEVALALGKVNVDEANEAMIEVTRLLDLIEEDPSLTEEAGGYGSGGWSSSGGMNC